MSLLNTGSQNRVKSDPSLTDVFEIYKKDIMLAFNCHAIGTVQSFNAAAQTATASINYKKTYLKPDPITGIYGPNLEDYPVLVDCPVFVSRGGLASLTMPITIGDTCIVLFNDRDMDNWHLTGQVGPVATQRLHSFSDAMILVGIASALNPVIPYDGSNAVLQNGPLSKVKVGLTKATVTNSIATVEVGPALVTIGNGVLTLNPLLQSLVSSLNVLISQLSILTVTCAAPGSPSSPPINAAAISAVSASLSATAAQIASILG